jgi:DNA-directed RNA polymerase beta' subunit
MQNATKLLQILIRSYLNTATLLQKGITDYALDIIIKRIRETYGKALVSYGTAIGIIAAQSISEPLTQMVLDSKHYSGASSTKKRGMFRVKEILGARPTYKKGGKGMKAPSMLLNVLPEYQHNKAKVREIANHIEMLSVRRFSTSMQIFFEKYGEPVHPVYKHEKKIIKEFEKYNVNIKAPGDLANWCIRISLSRSKLIIKQMKMETIYHKIRSNFEFSHVVYTTDNADEIIMRIYVRNIIAKKAHITVKQMKGLADNILDTVVRGITGINAAYVEESNRSTLQADGTIKKEKFYQIFTDGTNLEEILENPFIEKHTAQSDSILEIYEVLGIEAARTKIIDEMYIQVSSASYRHYTIYADEMTFTGMVTSVDRYGSAKRNSSIMLRISDASPIGVIEESAINATSDNLQGISAPIMMGKNPRVGDLYNTYIVDEEFVKENTVNLESILSEL